MQSVLRRLWMSPGAIMVAGAMCEGRRASRSTFLIHPETAAINGMVSGAGLYC